jgi:hypothetical protein
MELSASVRSVAAGVGCGKENVIASSARKKRAMEVPEGGGADSSKKHARSENASRSSFPHSSSFGKQTAASMARQLAEKEQEAFDVTTRRRTTDSFAGRPLTIPRGPSLSTETQSSRRSKIESSEELENRRITGMQEELDAMRRKNRRALVRNRRGVQAAIHSTKPLTIPASPKMATADRLGERSYAVIGNQEEEPLQSPPHPLRPKSPSMMTAVGGLTVPIPFNLETEKRAPAERSGERRETFGEVIARIDSQPPARFRSKPEPLPVGCSQANALTLPKSPRFVAKGRAPARPLSQDERDAEMMERISANPFRAKPYTSDAPFMTRSKRALEQEPKMTGSKKARRSTSASQRSGPGELTVAVSPKLSSRGRQRPLPKSRDELEAEEVAQKQFRARPIPNYQQLATRGINTRIKKKPLTEVSPFELTPSDPKPSSVPERIPRSSTGKIVDRSGPRGLTVPKSPKLSTGARQRALPIAQDEQDAEVMKTHQFKARSIPNYGKLGRQGVSQVDRRQLTEATPFNLNTESRGEYKADILKQRQEREEHEMAAARRVVAKPAPDHTIPTLRVRRSSKPLTEMEPFDLASVSRKHAAEAALRKKEEEKNKEAMVAAAFKARPVPETLYVPEVPPTVQSAALTIPVECELSSSARVVERKLWDEKNKARMQEEELAAKKMKMDEKAAAEMELKKLRNLPASEGGFMFKAKEVYIPPPPKSRLSVTRRPLTEPHSPAFATRSRTRGVNSSYSSLRRGESE